MIPLARVKIEFLKILKIPAPSTTHGLIRYAKAGFQPGSEPTRSTGRSKPIPPAAKEFDVSAEQSPWVFEADVNSGDIITISVQVWEDYGDPGPLSTYTFATVVGDPWTAGEQTFDGLVIRVTTTVINPVDKAYLARGVTAPPKSGALAVPRGFYVEFTDIQGLWKPNAKVVPPAPGASHVAGYASDDDQGRIFTNRQSDGAWKSGTQFIDVFVKVTALGAVSIPGGAKINWTIVDVDDPTNDRSDFHRRWGPYVDANDYDSAGKSLGAVAKDNALAFRSGNTDDNLLFGVSPATARWEQTPGGTAVTASSGEQASSDLKSTGAKKAVSSVRIHCPNVLGTNFVLKAEFSGAAAGIPVFNAQTGVMTMWSRLDVEVTRMDGALSLESALPLIPPFFQPACVQLDFQKENKVTGALDREELAKADALLEEAASVWASDRAVFTNVGKPGWFFLGGARLPYPLIVGETGDITTGSKKVKNLSSPGTKGLNENSSVAGDGIPWGAKVHSIDDPTSITLTTAATKTASGVNLQFGPIFINQTGNTTSGSKKVTGLSPGATHLVANMPVSGDGIPDDTTIDSVDSHTAVTLSHAATKTNTGTALVFEPKRTLYRGTSYSFSATGSSVFVEVPGNLADAEFAWFAWKRGSVWQNAIFGVGHSDFLSLSGSTLLLLQGSDITPAFTGDDSDGSADHAYKTLMEFLPGHQRALSLPGNPDPPLSPGGITIPSDAILMVKRAGAGFTGGVSPNIPNAAGTGSFFAGRTIVFTRTTDPAKDFNTQVLVTIVHELVHAFGMPHKCGNWDWLTPREHSCCMNYNYSWLVDEDKLNFPWPDLAKKLAMKPSTIDKQDNHMCARHLMEVRRVHLEKNLGLNWH